MCDNILKFLLQLLLHTTFKDNTLFTKVEGLMKFNSNPTPGVISLLDKTKAKYVQIANEQTPSS